MEIRAYKLKPFSNVSDDPLLNIKAVAEATGIESVTLRAWERRYGVPSPARSEQGHRLYSDRDVAILNWLKTKTEVGVTISQAVAVLEAESPQAPEPPRTLNLLTPSLTSIDTMIDALLDAAHQYDTSRVQQIIAQAFALFSVEDVCLNLLLPALRRIGVEWRQEAASLQVEHFLTNLIRQNLLALLAAMPAPSRAGRVVAGCAPNDWHEIAVLMLTLFLRRRGWDVIYLGQAVGLDRLAETLEDIHPDVVVMSASHYETIRSLPDIERIVHKADTVDQFAFGGPIFAAVPDLAQRVPGIYIGDTLTDATERLDNLLAGYAQPLPNHPPDQNSAQIEAAYAVEGHLSQLTSHLSRYLSDADPTLSSARVSDVVRQRLMTLLCALEFDLPQILDGDNDHHGSSLRAHRVPSKYVEALFRRTVSADQMETLKPFIAEL